MFTKFIVSNLIVGTVPSYLHTYLPFLKITREYGTSTLYLQYSILQEFSYFFNCFRNLQKPCRRPFIVLLNFEFQDSEALLVLNKKIENFLSYVSVSVLYHTVKIHLYTVRYLSSNFILPLGTVLSN
jgi:hypothetical protein